MPKANGLRLRDSQLRISQGYEAVLGHGLGKVRSLELRARADKQDPFLYPAVFCFVVAQKRPQEGGMPGEGLRKTLSAFAIAHETGTRHATHETLR